MTRLQRNRLGGAVFSALVVHELGHLLAALGFGVSPSERFLRTIADTSAARRAEISVCKRIFSDSISATPSSVRNWRVCMLIVIAAEPMFTLISGLMAVSFGFSNQVLQLAFVQVSVLLFMLGLIPNARLGQTRHHARLFIDLWVRKPAAEELAAPEKCDSRIQNAARTSSAFLDVLVRGDLESARIKFGRVGSYALFPGCLVHRYPSSRANCIGSAAPGTGGNYSCSVAAEGRCGDCLGKTAAGATPHDGSAEWSHRNWR